MGTQGTRPNLAGDLVLDAGALIAYERGDPRTRAIVKQGSRNGQVIVPAGTLAQAWRGGPRSAPLARLIAASAIDSLDERRAKEVGVRLGARGATDVTDAHVVSCAVERPSRVATSDPNDLGSLANPGEHLSLIEI